MAKHKERKRNWDDVRWTRFEATSPPPFTDATDGAGTGTAKWVANSIYVVRINVLRSVAPFGDFVHLAIQTHDQQPRHDWRELQQIKNEIVGTDVEAVELYPSEDRLIDRGNQYHLFCFPRLATPDGWFPFGFRARVVSEGSDPGINETGRGFRQRDFRPELRPQDALHADGERSEALNFRDEDKVAGRCPLDGSAIVFRGGEPTHGHCLKGNHRISVAVAKEAEAERS